MRIVSGIIAINLLEIKGIDCNGPNNTNQIILVTIIYFWVPNQLLTGLDGRCLVI